MKTKMELELEEEEDEDEEEGDDVDALVDDEEVELVDVELVDRYTPAAAIIITTMTTTSYNYSAYSHPLEKIRYAT